MINYIKILNPLTIPLYKKNIIEASAGTGKTYVISIIYLRLLLGLGDKNSYSRPLSVKEILILTDNKESNINLIKLIKKFILKLIYALKKKKSNNLFINLLLKQINCFNKAYLYLLKAQKEINNASIFTLYNFYKHILYKYHIKYNIDLKNKNINNKKLSYIKIINDFWRHYFYKLPLALTKFIINTWKNPEYLLKMIMPYLNKIKVNKIIDINKSILLYHKNIIYNINKLKIYLYKILPFIIKLIKNYKIKKINLYLNYLNKWIEKPINDYIIPNELIHIKKFFLKKKLFIKISILYNINYIINNIKKKIISLNKLIFKLSCIEIYNIIIKKPYLLNINNLENKINKIFNNEKLINKIYKNYPLIIIDNFHNINIKQYNILKKFYYEKQNYALTIIGDKKQLIYELKNKNIFKYIYQKEKFNNYYTLNINWRSTKTIFNAINTIFKYNNNLFISKKKNFPLVNVNKYNTSKLIVNNKISPGIYIWAKINNKKKILKYNNFIIKNCIININNLIQSSKLGKSWFETKKIKKKIKLSDIIILVSNKIEADIIYKELKKNKIPSTNLINNKNVFKTLEAIELLIILKAILNPKNIILLKNALITNTFLLKRNIIYNINNNEKLLLEWIKEFLYYKKTWDKIGILSTLHEIINKNYILNKILKIKNGKRKLINLLHITELLQEKSIKIKNKNKLLNWLKIKIKFSTLKKSNKQRSLEINKNTIKILTINESAGLEFPVVFIPFINNLNNNIILNKLNKKNVKKNIKLLYIAITRCIYHCNISIEIPFYKYKNLNKFKKININEIKYLILNHNNEKKLNILYNYLKNLIKNSKGDIVLRKIILIKKNFDFVYNKKYQLPFKIKKNNINNINNNLNIISYTKLYNYKIKKSINVNFSNYKNNIKKNKLTPHMLERSVFLGKFIHFLLKKINFQKSINKKWLKFNFIKNNINLLWLPVIKNWINHIIKIPLNKTYLSLSKINIKYYNTELKFYFSIKKNLQTEKINILCKKYDPISLKCKNINFPNISGIMTGIIDLFFYWEKKYYLLDYKTNWLGINNNFYNKKNIEKSIIKNRYDLQYQIYTLALHRFLKTRISNYNYQNDFGGIFILFLRGIEYNKNNNTNNGIYYYKLKFNFIESFDKMFN